jgi:uncharacterized OsmC-like protein
MSITNHSTADNGVNVGALLGAKAALTDAPAAAQFTWKAGCQWINGTHSRTTFQTFSGLGQEQSHKQAFDLDTDHPAIFASEDNGVTPTEMVLAGLAGCLTAGIASVATHRGIQLTSVAATVEADMDLSGILGIDADVRNGFSAIRVHYVIDADATPDAIEAVVAQSQKRSAVYDIVANPTTITVSVV